MFGILVLLDVVCWVIFACTESGVAGMAGMFLIGIVIILLPAKLSQWGLISKEDTKKIYDEMDKNMEERRKIQKRQSEELDAMILNQGRIRTTFDTVFKRKP